jgi:hypothetical protein
MTAGEPTMVTGLVAVLPPAARVMVAVPGLTPVTRPPTTVATDESEDDQRRFRTMLLPAESLTIGMSVPVAPTAMLGSVAGIVVKVVTDAVERSATVATTLAL